MPTKHKVTRAALEEAFRRARATFAERALADDALAEVYKEVYQAAFNVVSVRLDAEDLYIMLYELVAENESLRDLTKAIQRNG